MDVSIIIVNYNSGHLTAECIHSVFRRTSGLTYEVIVVDNDSHDDSIDLLKKEFKEAITIIPAEENLGFGKANNLGVQQANGNYLFLLNPDTILVNDAINELYNFIKDKPNVGIVGGNLYTPSMTPNPSFCLKFDSIELEREKAKWSTIIQSKIRQKLGIVSVNEYFNITEDPIEVAYIFGADMFMSKKLFDSIHGFDPDFFMYAEEEELSYRVSELGYMSMNIPSAKIIHLEGVTQKKINSFNEKQFRMRMQGIMLYYQKRFGMEGVNDFYRWRNKQYERLIQIGKMQGKDVDDLIVSIQKKCLGEVYQEFFR